MCKGHSCHRSPHIITLRIPICSHGQEEKCICSPSDVILCVILKSFWCWAQAVPPDPPSHPWPWRRGGGRGHGVCEAHNAEVIGPLLASFAGMVRQSPCPTLPGSSWRAQSLHHRLDSLGQADCLHRSAPEDFRRRTSAVSQGVDISRL